MVSSVDSPDASARIGEAVERLLGPSPYLTREHRTAVTESLSDDTRRTVEDLLDFACSPAEIWTSAASLADAASQVEPRIRDRFPYLSDRAIELLLNYACFSWK